MMNRLAYQEPQQEDIGKIQELIYELKSEAVMQRKLEMVSPETPMMDVKNLLLEHWITGAPVMEGDACVGFISLVEVIECLEHGACNRLARDMMAPPPFPKVYPEEPVAQALNQLVKFNARRVLVFDHQEKLAGMITSSDITGSLLKALDRSYHEEEISQHRAGRIFQDIESEDTRLVLRYSAVADDFTHGGEASSKIKKALQRLGVHPQDVRKVAISVYEAELNLIIHTTRGGTITTEITPQKLTITVKDDGPGIPDIEKAMEVGYSTAPLKVKALGFGAGMGLKNIKRCMDEMTLESNVGDGPGKGTTLSMVLYPSSSEV
jgi:anti-sigma regulatory factor (Ser/Thr protein kinase)/CBS domain-containing protein